MKLDIKILIIEHKKISKLFYEWINELTKKFENYIKLLNNYLCFEKVIVSDIKKYYDLKQTNINRTFK